MLANSSALPFSALCFLNAAYTHQAYPLVYRNVRELRLPAVPDAVQTSLKGAYWPTRCATMAHFLRCRKKVKMWRTSSGCTSAPRSIRIV